MFNTYLQGFGIGLSLIVAIGAQNAFILKQGLLKQRMFWLCFICAVSDSLLIAAGVFGFSHLVVNNPEVIKIAKYCGSAFLIIYGAQHFYQALFKSNSMRLDAEPNQQHLKKLIYICLALTWLNPYVYLDTVVLVGSISTQFEQTKIYYLLGAVSASWLFFFSLGYGSRYLLPLFQSEKSWKILDSLIGLVMWWIAFRLLECL